MWRDSGRRDMWSQCGLGIHPSLKEWHRCRQEDPQPGYLKSITIAVGLSCSINIHKFRVVKFAAMTVHENEFSCLPSTITAQKGE